jgi:hypothetical protein
MKFEIPTEIRKSAFWPTWVDLKHVSPSLLEAHKKAESRLKRREATAALLVAAVAGWDAKDDRTGLPLEPGESMPGVAQWQPDFAAWLTATVHEMASEADVRDAAGNKGPMKPEAKSAAEEDISDSRARLQRAMSLKKADLSRTWSDIGADQGVGYTDRQLRNLRKRWPNG